MKKKSLLLIAAFCLLPFLAMCQCAVLVVVEHLRNSDGKVRVALFDSEDTFPDKAAIGKVVSLSDKHATVVFEDIKPGRYAVAVIHDENGNGELDTNAIGIPLEGFGFGNNAMGMFGPPSFKRASIAVEKGTVTQKLRMRYF